MAKKNNSGSPPTAGKKCNFCGKGDQDNVILVEGPPDNSKSIVYICGGCAQLCVNMCQSPHKEKIDLKKIPAPKQLVEYLDQYVIGQDEAKRALAVGVHNHYKRLATIDNPEDNDFSEVEIDKSNILMIGPTGCGKTLLAQSLARQLNVPFAIGDATTLTEAGYVGEDVENLLNRLLVAADYDVELAERGIIYVDEVDKIGSTNQNVSITRDVSGAGVQQALLKMLEGTAANVPPAGGRKHPEQQYIRINTKDILFICGGTFVGLEKIISQRLGKKTLGFGMPANKDVTKEKNALLAQVTPDDLCKFGMIPEFVGRLPVLTHIEEMSVDSLKKVLLEPKNALIKQYQKLFYLDGVRLEFTSDAVEEIANKALTLGTGARALRSVVEKLMNPIMFDLSGMEECVITAAMVRGETPNRRAA